MIAAPSREAGLVALSRVVLEDIRIMIGALVPEDRARLADELLAELVTASQTRQGGTGPSPVAHFTSPRRAV